MDEDTERLRFFSRTFRVRRRAGPGPVSGPVSGSVPGPAGGLAEGYGTGKLMAEEESEEDAGLSIFSCLCPPGPGPARGPAPGSSPSSGGSSVGATCGVTGECVQFRRPNSAGGLKCLIGGAEDGGEGSGSSATSGYEDVLVLLLRNGRSVWGRYSVGGAEGLVMKTVGPAGAALLGLGPTLIGRFLPCQTKGVEM